MSLNTAHANGGVLIYSGERILIFYNGVEMTFDMDGNTPEFKGSKKGRAYLTTHRVIFNSKSTKDTLQSFTMPFHSMKEVELEQPVFGANYIKGKVQAEPQGNWEGEGKWKMYYTHGGAIEFGKAMLDAGRMASRFFSSQPPVYSAPTGPYYQPPPEAYCMPQAPMYSFVPASTFPTAPPYDGVYASSAPPPYPGIDPAINQQQQQAASANVNSHNAKAAEAAASAPATAYYNPADPHHVYAPQAQPQYPPPQQQYPPQQYPPQQYPPQQHPPQQYPPQYSADNEMPPSYNEATKKTQ